MQVQLILLCRIFLGFAVRFVLLVLDVKQLAVALLDHFRVSLELWVVFYVANLLRVVKLHQALLEHVVIIQIHLLDQTRAAHLALI